MVSRPVLDYFERRLGAPRVVAVVLAFLLGIFLFALLWTMIWISVASLANDADTYRDRLQELVVKVSSWIKEALPGNAKEGMQAASSASVETISSEFADYISANFRGWLGHLTSGLMDLLSSALMVFIFMFFLLLGDRSRSTARSSLKSEIESQVRSYIVSKTVISIFTAGTFGTVLWFYGIPLAIVFGMLAFLCNFIPNIGPVIASLLPLPLIVLHPDLSLTSMIVVVVLTSGIQFVSGNIVETKIMGDSFELHPIAILLTLMIWGMIWGIVGMFLAVPVTAAAKILLDKFEHTRPIANALAGRMDPGNAAAE